MAKAAYVVLRDEYARRHGGVVTLAELADNLFGRHESSFIANGLARGQVPSGLVLQRMRSLCQPAARLTDLIPAIRPDTSAAHLREIFASALTDLSASPLAADLGRARDIVFAPGIVRALHSPCWVSRLLLEVLLLRRRVDRDAINVVLMQGWYVAAALLDCVFRFSTLSTMAGPVWLTITDTLLPDIDSVKRYGGVVDVGGRGLVLDDRYVGRLTDDRVRLQTCVADALSMTETPLRIRHLFPDQLAVELYLHRKYRQPLWPGDQTQPRDTSRDEVDLALTSAAGTRHAGRREAGGAGVRYSEGRPHRFIAAQTPAPRALVPDTEPRRLIPEVRPRTNADGTVRPPRRPLGTLDLEPIPLDEELTRSFRVSDTPSRS